MCVIISVSFQTSFGENSLLNNFVCSNLHFLRSPPGKCRPCYQRQEPPQQCSSVYSSKLSVKVSDTRGVAASCDLAAKWEKKWGWKEYQKLPWLFHSTPVWRERVWIMFFVSAASDLTLTSAVTSWAAHQAGYEVPDVYSWTSNTCGWEWPGGQRSAVLRWPAASFQDVWQGRCCRRCPWAFFPCIVLSQEPLAQGKDEMREEGLVQQLQVLNWACLFGELVGAGLRTPPGCSGSPWAWGRAGQGDPRSVAFPGLGDASVPPGGVEACRSAAECWACKREQLSIKYTCLPGAYGNNGD